jgi:SAM-dependent MidA family methyltransferase
MKFTSSLPPPLQDEYKHSLILSKKIVEKINKKKGAITFQQFMQMALYEPQLGYYVAGKHKIGSKGDFITAPEVSNLYSCCLAQQIAAILKHFSQPVILELGAGRGQMAADILLQLAHLQQLPKYYYILEVSPDLRQQQADTIYKYAPDLIDRIVWLDCLPTTPIEGVIIANEVLDAMPVELFTLVNGERVTRHVLWKDDHFEFDAVEGDYTSEFNPAIPAWMQSLADSLASGAILLIDYGYEASDYYHPERNQGTLICHYQHHVHDNPLIYPGLQDITASVDFTAVANAGIEAGLELAGYTTQAEFLINSGLEDLFIQALNENPQTQYKLAQQVRMLTLPSEMGERFKVMAFTKNFTQPLSGFKIGDRRHRL